MPSSSTLMDVIAGALTAIGQLGQGQTANAEDAALGLRQANLLLGKQSGKRLGIFSVATRTYILQANVPDYTIGQGANATFNAARPTFIESAQICVPGSNVWLPLNILDKTQWDAIRNKGAKADVPDDIYPEYTYPNLGFHVSPAPIGTPAIKLGCWEPLTKFETVFEEIPFPDPYEEFLEAKLAIILAPYYDQPITQTLATRAQEAEIAVMQFNAQSMGGSLADFQKLISPNVGQPMPTPGGGAAPAA